MARDLNITFHTSAPGLVVLLLFLLVIVVLSVKLEVASAHEDQKPESTDYEKALEDGKKSIPYVKDFDRLFPRAHHYYTHYGLSKPEWHSAAGLYGRYIINMWMPVTLDPSRTKLKAFGEAQFQVLEVDRIEKEAEGVAGVTYKTANQRNFDTKTWKKLVEANGDLSVLGITVIKDKPIPGFEQIWRQS